MKQKVKTSVLEKITPTKEENNLLEQGAQEFISKLELAAKELQISCELFIGGSFGKGTYLRGNFDIDFFCRFSLTYDDKELTTLLKKIVTKAGIDFQKEKGSRDYYSGTYKFEEIEFSFEVIPVFAVEEESQAVNSTDLSPLHVDHIRNKIKEKPALRKEIRIAKQFLKAKGLYGAESYINGFSGHTVELLVSHYGSFKELLTAASKWGEQEIIDPAQHYTSTAKVLSSLDEDKISNLVLIDSIVKERNAARALSEEMYWWFVLLANSPAELTERDFVIPKKDLVETRRSNKLIALKNKFGFVAYEISLTTKNDSQDIIGSKLLKVSKRIQTYFEELDFTIFDSTFIVDFQTKRALMVFISEQQTLPSMKKIKGPEVKRISAVKGFIQNKKHYTVLGQRVYAYEARKITSFKKASNLSVKDLEKLFGKKLSFITKLKSSN